MPSGRMESLGVTALCRLVVQSILLTEIVLSCPLCIYSSGRGPAIGPLSDAWDVKLPNFQANTCGPGRQRHSSARLLSQALKST